MRIVRLGLALIALTLSPAACAHEKPARWSRAALTDLVQVADQAPEQGLSSEAVAAGEIRELLQESKRNPAAAGRLQEAADALYARLARNFGQGAVDPAADPEWRIPRAELTPEETAWASAGKNALPSEALFSLLPSTREYEALQQEYVRVLAEPEGASDAEGRPRQTRLHALRASLERLRWLPRGLGAVRVEARLPNYEVLLIRPEQPPAAFAAVVGARRTQTPSFAATIDGVILNPTWTPPRSILVNELLPDMRGSVRARAGYDVLDARGRVVDPDAVDWSARPFPYTLRQRAGAGNALGRIKFDMPNPFDVYMHDTPARSLFERPQRAFSHGCIRVERPVELAAALLGEDASVLDASIDAGGTETRRLAEPVPFYALYLTASAWDGAVRYADDVYGRDEAIVSALDAPEPEQVTATVAEAARCPA